MPAEDKTMNAVLLDRVAGSWRIGGLDVGQWFITIALASEAGLLLIAAQAGFVDDPRAAVADAAELVEHTAQTLIGSLQQRQRALRTQWDDNGSGAASSSATGELTDTEQLRHLMQDYRNLFNQLVQP